VIRISEQNVGMIAVWKERYRIAANYRESVS
jgi:hypothetical protein